MGKRKYVDPYQLELGLNYTPTEAQERIRGVLETYVSKDRIEEEDARLSVNFTNLMGVLTEAMKKDITERALGSEGGIKLPQLIKLVRKNLRTFESVLTPQMYSEIMNSGLYHRFDSEVGVMILFPYTNGSEFCTSSTEYDDELTKCNSNHKYVATRYLKKKEFFVYDSIENIEAFKEGDLSLEISSRLEWTNGKTYLNHYGFHDDGSIIVTESGRDILQYLLEGTSNSDFYKEQSKFTVDHTGFNGQIGSLMRSDTGYPYRNFLTGTSIIPDGHDKDITVSQNIVVNKIYGKGECWNTLAELESQARKLGPKARSTQTEFWSQVMASYKVPTLSERAKVAFNEAAREVTEYLLSRVGKLKPWPLFAGVKSQLELLTLFNAIHYGSKTISKEAYEFWLSILKASNEIQCVYSSIKKNTNKGAPYYTSKLTPIEWLRLGILFYERMKDPSKCLNTIPFIVGERIQNSTWIEEKKTFKQRDRAIMMMAAVYLEQQQFNLPLMEALKQIPEFTSYLGHHAVGEVLESKLSEYLEKDINFTCLSLDYSKYDTCVGGELQEDGLWDLLAALFEQDSNPSENGFENIDKYVNNIGHKLPPEYLEFKGHQPAYSDEEYFSEVFQLWKSFYTEVPLIIPGGVLVGKHGLFSGAPGTTHVGSLLNFIRVKAVSKMLGINVLMSMFQGDDTILAYTNENEDTHVDLRNWSEIMSEFGHLVANDAVKQAYMETNDHPNPYFMFVGKYYFIKGIPTEFLYKDIYPITDMVARMIYPEGQKVSSDESKIRDWSNYDFNKYKYMRKSKKASTIHPSVDMAVKIVQALTNTRFHPLHKEVVVDFVKSKPGIFKPIIEVSNTRDYYDILNESGTLIGLSKDDFETGFTSSETVQLILETLRTVDHEYVDVIYIEDLEKSIELAKNAKKDMKADVSPSSYWGTVKSKLSGIINPNLLESLKDEILDTEPLSPTE